MTRTTYAERTSRRPPSCRLPEWRAVSTIRTITSLENRDVARPLRPNDRIPAPVRHGPVRPALHLLHADGFQGLRGTGRLAHVRRDRAPAARLRPPRHAPHPPDGRRAAAAPPRDGPGGAHRRDPRRRRPVAVDQCDHPAPPRAGAAAGRRGTHQREPRHARPQVHGIDHGPRQPRPHPGRHHGRQGSGIRSHQDQHGRHARRERRRDRPHGRILHRPRLRAAADRSDAHGRDGPQLRLHGPAARACAAPAEIRPRAAGAGAGRRAGALPRHARRPQQHRLHHAAVAALLRHVQPRAPGGGRHAVPVPGPGREIRVPPAAARRRQRRRPGRRDPPRHRTETTPARLHGAAGKDPLHERAGRAGIAARRPASVHARHRLLRFARGPGAADGLRPGRHLRRPQHREPRPAVHGGRVGRGQLRHRIRRVRPGSGARRGARACPLRRHPRPDVGPARDGRDGLRRALDAHRGTGARGSAARAAAQARRRPLPRRRAGQHPPFARQPDDLPVAAPARGSGQGRAAWLVFRHRVGLAARVLPAQAGIPEPRATAGRRRMSTDATPDYPPIPGHLRLSTRIAGALIGFLLLALTAIGTTLWLSW
ncbi:hypothetical protein Lal_00014979, partial [Lupinus albus]